MKSIKTKQALCIDESWKIKGQGDVAACPTFGEKVTLTQSFTDKHGTWYTLAGYDQSDEFHESAFMPLSNVDESQITLEDRFCIPASLN